MLFLKYYTSHYGFEGFTLQFGNIQFLFDFYTDYKRPNYKLITISLQNMMY